MINDTVKILAFCCTLALGPWIQAAEKALCLGPEAGAQLGLVYLHGWDAPEIGRHEMANRRLLGDLAKKHGWRVAVPRGDGTCNQGRSRCWAIRSRSEIHHSHKILLSAARQCINPNLPWGVVGFSNGGYFISALFHLQLLDSSVPLLSFGAGGHRSTRQALKQVSTQPFTLALGKSDGVYKAAKRYSLDIQQKNPAVQFLSFAGGHQLHPATLLNWSQNLLPSK